MNLLDKITVFENVFSPQTFKKIQESVYSPNWYFGEYSDLDSSHKMFWNLDLTDNEYFNDHLFLVIKNIINKNLKIDRIHVNGQTYGLDGSFHTDIDDGYTFLYYCNTYWNPSLGGSTVFMDESTGQIENIYPKPNRAILFPGNILHYGQSPSRDYYDLRLTLVYKLY